LLMFVRASTLTAIKRHVMGSNDNTMIFLMVKGLYQIYSALPILKNNMGEQLSLIGEKIGSIRGWRCTIGFAFHLL
jgi:hypothetical protein